MSVRGRQTISVSQRRIDNQCQSEEDIQSVSDRRQTISISQRRTDNQCKTDDRQSVSIRGRQTISVSQRKTVSPISVSVKEVRTGG